MKSRILMGFDFFLEKSKLKPYRLCIIYYILLLSFILPFQCYSTAHNPIFRIKLLKETFEQISKQKETYNLQIGDSNLLISLNLFSNNNDSFYVCSKGDMPSVPRLLPIYQTIGDNFLINNSQSLVFGFKIIQPYPDEYIPFRDFKAYPYFKFKSTLYNFDYLKQRIQGVIDESEIHARIKRQGNAFRFIKSEVTSRIFNQVLSHEVFSLDDGKKMLLSELITIIPFGLKANYLIIYLISFEPTQQDVHLLKFIRNSISLKKLYYSEQKVNYDNNSIQITVFDLTNEAEVHFNKAHVLNTIKNWLGR
jgi:hypothetical protein